MSIRVHAGLLVMGALGAPSVVLADGEIEKVLKKGTTAILKGVEEITPITTQSAQKAVVKGIDDVVQAGDSAAKFADQQRRLPFETVDKAFHQKNVGKSFEFLVTHPVRQTNANAKQAVASSPVLAAAASIAASAYGGPAGAAAFAAWTTYNATGSIEAALKVGATQGLIASATASVNAMPAGADKVAAQTALTTAVSKAQGDSSEETKKKALGSLVTLSGGAVKTAGLSAAQRTMAMAAIGGAAVAASGGNRDAIRNGFLQGGGKVLAQELSAAKDDAVNKIKAEAKAHVGVVLSEKQIAAANKAYQQVKNTLTDSEVAKKIEAAKKKYEEAKTAVAVDVKERTAKLTEARKTVMEQRAAIQKEEQNLKKVAAEIQADAKRTFAQVGGATPARLRAMDMALQDVHAKSHQAIAAANAEIARASGSVRDHVIGAIADELQAKKNSAQTILDDGTIVSWNATELLSANNDRTSVRLAVPKSSEDLLDFFYGGRK